MIELAWTRTVVAFIGGTWVVHRYTCRLFTSAEEVILYVSDDYDRHCSSICSFVGNCSITQYYNHPKSFQVNSSVDRFYGKNRLNFRVDRTQDGWMAIYGFLVDCHKTNTSERPQYMLKAQAATIHYLNGPVCHIGNSRSRSPKSRLHTAAGSNLPAN